jgi:hypothetical protein
MGIEEKELVILVGRLAGVAKYFPFRNQHGCTTKFYLNLIDPLINQYKAYQFEVVWHRPKKSPTVVSPLQRNQFVKVKGYFETNTYQGKTTTVFKAVAVQLILDEALIPIAQPMY